MKVKARFKTDQPAKGFYLMRQIGHVMDFPGWSMSNKMSKTAIANMIQDKTRRHPERHRPHLGLAVLIQTVVVA